MGRHAEEAWWGDVVGRRGGERGEEACRVGVVGRYGEEACRVGVVGRCGGEAC